MTSEQGAAAKNLSKVYSDVDKPGNEYLVASHGVEIQDTIPKDVLEKSTILCGDNSEQMVTIVKRTIAAEGWVNTTATVLEVSITSKGRDQWGKSS
ncbi:hypothetical protein QQZ08_009824 [Neonectria magnoliae]|uniref:Uncharacterized protein n=1 Tax=Neonectria magnoliae TaxID=2732573 RepID=A0ABR1HKV4_9HYPO